MAKVKYGTVLEVKNNEVQQPTEYTKVCIKCGEVFTTSEGWATKCNKCSAKKTAPKKVVEQVKETNTEIVFEPKLEHPNNYKPNNHDSKEWNREQIENLQDKVEIEELKIKQLQRRIDNAKANIKALTNQIHNHEVRIAVVESNKALFG